MSRRAGLTAVNGGDRIADVLAARRVPFLFTLCGGHISPILVAAKRRGIRVVDVRHEATAVFAADAVARLTGAPGFAAVTAGPGATNTITAVKNAQLAQSAVVLLVGATATALKGRGALQDIDQAALLRPHVKLAVAVRKVRDLAPALDRAMVLAASGVPGPVSVECPVDLLYDEELVRGWYGSKSGAATTLRDRLIRAYLRRHVDRMFAGADAATAPSAGAAATPEPDDGAVRRAADRLRAADRPVILVGSQSLVRAQHAGAIAAALERIGAPVYLSGMARGLLGRAHPLHCRHRRRDALKEADVVVLAGVPCDFRLDYGRQIRGRSVLIAANRSRADLRLNRRPDVAVRGDAGRFLEALAEATDDGDRARWEAWRSRLRERDDAREEDIRRQAAAVTELVNPVRLCRAIEAAVADDGVLVADGGDFVATASYIVRPRGPLSWLDPGPFGTLGVGAGFALGAKLCHPESEVWLLYGDGSAGYSLAEFDTFARHGVPVIAVVGNDACWTQIAREQVEVLKDDVGCALGRTDYHAVARGFGAEGLLVDDDDRVDETLVRAKSVAADGRPVLVNAHLGKTEFRKGSISI